jgi:prepilin-type N-terminal cleavage/methylation domain-containing protein
MSSSSHITRFADDSAGFTLIELLVVALVAGTLMAAFTGFYVSQHRAVRRNEVEIETSQALRAAAEQITRDVRDVGRDLTRNLLANSIPRFNTAAASDIDFYVDQYDCGIVGSGCSTPDGGSIASPQRKRYRYNSGTIEQCTCNGNGCSPSCSVLADFAGSLSLTFSYYDCGGTALTSLPLSSTDRNKIGRVDIKLNLFQGMVGGTNITRTETNSVTIRNLCN